ncbi:sulfotransferase [Mucilaginibacter sp. ZT4R22]|uniref:Sulfotransferase n=1 Tax=Mucilaginibacter pankratovii TaxID=2772110 RepID=A0ABR7WY00_9SPHI|nr:sulfotransferase [Mucilaginibacter pankratovii]MBD1367068.1 sulfotransferase [Mucilaginibacter pankratovii]
MLASIIQTEARLHNLLPQQRLEGSVPADLLTAAREWSQLVWDVAEQLGPMPLSKKQVEDGLNLATRPVFICGVHRSGTTLVRNLLDGHPQLCVLPSEGTFYTNLEAKLKQLPPDKWPAYMGTEWLRRLANPINQPPYWLLGRSCNIASPYVDFARYLLSWWQAIEQAPGTQWPHMAVVLAYASCTWGLNAKYWVDKTPTNERFLNHIRLEAPNARIIHVIREPLATIASRRVMEPGAGIRGALRALKASYIIARREGGLKQAGYLLLRYEELCDDPQATTCQMASFLGIKNLPVLGQATVAGVSAKANSSFNKNSSPGEILKASNPKQHTTLGKTEQALIAAYLGLQAGQLGYVMPKVIFWEGAWLRLKNRLLI